MNTVQDQILRWIATEPASMGLFIFGLGLLFGFEGWRFYRVLLGVVLATVGWIAGVIAGQAAGMPPMLLSVAGVALGGFIAWKATRWAETLGTASVAGAYGLYLGEQCHFPGSWPLACGAITAGLGAMFANVARRTIPTLVTALIGGFLMVVGVVGMTATYIPSFSNTFRDWAHAWPLIGPIMVGMAIAMSYAYQSNHRQGSMISGV